MNSDLVSPSCLWVTKYYRVVTSFIVVNKFEECLSCLCLWSILEGYIFGFGSGPESFNIWDAVDAQRTDHCQFFGLSLLLFLFITSLSSHLSGLACLTEISKHSRIVDFRDLIGDHGLTEFIRALPLLSKEDNARCLPVKSMHGLNIRVATLKLSDF